jgi:hypothetical protein
LNRLFALPAKLGEMKIISISKPLADGLNTAGIWIFFVVVGIFGFWVLREFFGNIKVLRGEA